MSRTRKNATIADVASHSHVSTATVSRILNNSGPASEALRSRVESAARDLGYVSSRRVLHRGGSTLVVLIFTPDLLNPYFNEVIKVIEDSLPGESHKCITCSATALDHVTSAIDALSTTAIAGIICFGGVLSNAETLALGRRCRTPIVLIGQLMDNPAVRCINIDYALSMSQGVLHLLELGHREFAFIGGRHGSDTGGEKIRGIRETLATRGLSLPDSRMMFGGPTTDWGMQAVLTLLRGASGAAVPTGILCSCDLIALGALHAIRTLRYSVPDDFSVLGFDDIRMGCHSDPPLTTISPPKEKLGRLAASLVTEGAAHQPAVSNYTVFDSSLIVRGSTGRANLAISSPRGP
jgi:LacI family transcriptional regulator